MRIYLELGKDAGPAHRARITYAFRLFCAIYGHEPVVNSDRAASADVWICYAPATAVRSTKPSLCLSNLYHPRPLRDPAPPPRGFVHEGEATVLFYEPLPDKEPDWLGEVFEWVSCADEYSIQQRDLSGRIPFSATYAGRYNLDIRIPYAAVAMRLLNRALCRVVPRAATEPLSPVPRVSHFIVSTHDVDYLPAGRFNAVRRLAKFATGSCLLSKRFSLGFRQLGMALKTALGGRNPLDQVPTLLQGERKRGVGSSFYFLLRHLHRRDANYTLHNPPGLANLLRSLQEQGTEVGVHGSYTSLDTPQGLEEEYAQLRVAGFSPQGGRQHWLRYTLDRLIPAMERVGALYDTSVGWSERIGFRAGACFAFPPYNFAEERPSTFLELPLAIMDQSIQEGLDRDKDWYSEAADLLLTSSRYGWGGISLLWHPTAFGGGWLEPEIGNIFWRLVDNREKWNDTWTSAASFVQTVRHRYVEVGLLPAQSGALETLPQDRQPDEEEFANA